MSIQSQIDFLIEEYDQLKSVYDFLLNEYGEEGAKSITAGIVIKMSRYEKIIATLSNL